MQGRIQKAQNALYRQRWALAAAALGAVTFLLLYGVRVLDPTEVDWFINRGGDPTQHYLGWEFYRQSPWRLPYLGMSYNVIYPHRTSVLYTDSLPLFALFFKVLSPLLPQRFQYFGLWGILCFALQGFLGQKCIARIGRAEGSTVKCAASLLGAQAIVMYPVLAVRMFNHTALAGNWLLLAALYLWSCSADPAMTTRRACFWWGVLGALVVTIHMYYLPMVGMILVGAVVRRALQRRPIPDLVLPIPVYCGTALAVLFVLGAFAGNYSSPSLTVGGAADFLNLIVPGFYETWELDIYIGAGLVLALALAVLALVLALVCRPHWLEPIPAGARDWAISSAVILFLAFVVSSTNTIVLGGHTLFTWPVPDLLYYIWGLFRVCGRLAWTAGYLLAVLGCGVVLRLWRPRAALALLAVCLAVQTGYRWADCASIADYFRQDENYAADDTLHDPGWEVLAAQDTLQHMQFTSADRTADAFMPLCAFAARQGWSINNFYLPHAEISVVESTVAGQTGALSPDTVYVFLGINELRRYDYSLHYYRLDGILVGTVDPLPLPEEAAPAPAEYRFEPAAAFDAPWDSAAAAQPDGSVRLVNGSMSGPTQSLWPGNYEVTLEGSGLDNSYVYSGWNLTHYPFNQLDLQWVEGGAEKMVFRFNIQEVAFNWVVSVHALSDAPVTVDRFTLVRLF